MALINLIGNVFAWGNVVGPAVCVVRARPAGSKWYHNCYQPNTDEQYELDVSQAGLPVLNREEIQQLLNSCQNISQLVPVAFTAWAGIHYIA